MGRVWLQPQKPTPESRSINTMSPSWQGPCHQAQVRLRRHYTSHSVIDFTAPTSPPTHLTSNPSLTMSLAWVYSS